MKAATRGDGRVRNTQPAAEIHRERKTTSWVAVSVPVSNKFEIPEGPFRAPR